MSQPTKRQRLELSLSDKIKLIKDHESQPKISQRVLGEKFKVGKSTVGDILRKKDFYLEQFEKNASPKKSRFNNTCKFFDINDVVFKWFSTARAKGIPISGPIIQEKALQYSAELQIPGFKASNGWLDRWKNRYSVTAFKISGESASVDPVTVEDYRQRLPDITADYDPKDIFNCDETGLFYRALPDKTLNNKDIMCKGGKSAKERLTVMFACSATGEKLKPLVIGKSNQPRCFKNIKKTTLPVDYTANKKAWMTSEIFNNWILAINNSMKKQRRHILMFLDNASSHSHELRLSNVKLKFLPANTTSVLQPLDQGVIRAFKARYRKLMIKSLITKIDQTQSATELCKEISILDAIYWISRAWKDTKDSTIQKCFKLAGFPSPDQKDQEDPSISEDEDDDIPLIQLARQLRELPSDFDSNFDGSVPTEDDSDDWEKDLLGPYQRQETLESDDEEESVNETSSEPTMSLEETLQQLRKIHNQTTEESIKPMTGEIILQLEDLVVMKRSKTAQTTLDKFFK
ncbi:tigger transposable element-derived protein 6-like [Saccostrea cucullata]|uniref:tigger transposable element-derived protein 6-like n=1 Tax=Saccostrea cuccullata TaxID=36930 RepID=UPI002ED64A60